MRENKLPSKGSLRSIFLFLIASSFSVEQLQNPLLKLDPPISQLLHHFPSSHGSMAASLYSIPACIRWPSFRPPARTIKLGHIQPFGSVKHMEYFRPTEFIRSDTVLSKMCLWKKTYLRSWNVWYVTHLINLSWWKGWVLVNTELFGRIKQRAGLPRSAWCIYVYLKRHGEDSA